MPSASVGVVGRFSLTEALVQGRPLPSPTERALAVAEQLLWACGILDNELVSALSRGLAPANDVKAALRAMEDQGAIRRGYFVDGAAGLQYGTPPAVEALRALRTSTATDEDVFVVSAIDPAQPFGADVPWASPTSPRGPEVASAQRAASSVIIADVDDLDATGSDFTAHPLHMALPSAGFVKSADGWVWPLPRQPVGPSSPSLASRVSEGITDHPPTTEADWPRPS